MSQHFDLVDHDKLQPDNGFFRIQKHTKFTDFKQLVGALGGGCVWGGVEAGWCVGGA